MGQVAGLAPEVGRDASAGPVAVGDGGQDRVVQANVTQVRLVAEQVARLPEQRAGRVQYGPLYPAVEVISSRGCVVAGELTPVGRSAANDGVHLDREPRIRHVPEPAGQAVVQGRDDELEPGPAAQRRAPASSLPMNDRADPHNSSRVRLLLALAAQRSEGVLDDRRQRRVRPGQVRELVDDHGNRTVAAQREQRIDYLVPVREPQRRRCSEVRAEGRSDPAQRLAVGRLIRREVEAARGLAQRAEQERLALAPPPGDHAQGGSGPGVVRRTGRAVSIRSPGRTCRSASAPRLHLP